jgi:hypothetical protein
MGTLKKKYVRMRKYRIKIKDNYYFFRVEQDQL